MARETIFEEQEVSGFAQDGGTEYFSALYDAPAFEVGETYTVSWDGVEHEYTSQGVDGIACLGAENCDPFAISYIPAGLLGNETPIWYIATVSNAESHIIGLYQKEAIPEKIIIKDPLGNDVEYPDKPMIRLNTTKGTVLYSKGQILDGLTIQPDFSAGDMEITAPDGYLVQSAVIAKPSALVPENIAKDVEIAGIVGTHEGGGGGGAVECVEWVQVMHYATKQQATAVSGTVKATIPKDCLERNVYTSKLVASGSSAVTITSGVTPQYAWGETGLTVTENDTHITFAYTNKWNSGVTSVKHKYMMIQIIVGFVMGNMYIDTSSGLNVLIGKPGLKYLPIVESSGYVSCSENLAKIDFSQASIEKYERLTVDYDANLTEVILPKSCTTIGKYAYASCNVLTKLYSPDVAVVADYQINLPNVKTIEDGAFRATKTFKTAVLPSVETIGNHAFYLCSALTTIDMSGVSAVPTLGSSTTIPTNSGLQILVPAAMYDEWIAATNWTAYADYIVAV